jgi:threonine dehydratase
MHMTSKSQSIQSETPPVTIDGIREAHTRIRPHIHRTPVMTSASLNEIAGAQLFFKCENLQRTGSFKIRGATNAVLSLTEEQAKNGLAAPSSGNHAAAVSLAARERGLPAFIVMPRNASPAKIRAVEAYGGQVTFSEPNITSREAVTADVIAKTGAHMVHPYNDKRVISGQGTAALELLEEIPDLDVMIAPVSGGGLLSGTAIATKAVKPAVRVLGAEPRNADDAWRSYESGKIEPAAATQTIADGLRATLCPLTFEAIRTYVDGIELVSEEAIVSTMLLLWERAKLVVEPSGAVSAAAAMAGKFQGHGLKIGVILSGGNLDLKNLPFGS